MTKLSPERLRDIAMDVRCSVWPADEQITMLCNHIDALEAENVALAKVADASLEQYEAHHAWIDADMPRGGAIRERGQKAELALRAAFASIGYKPRITL